MSLNEIRQHGTDDFPFQIYHTDHFHPRYQMAFHWHDAVELIWVREGSLSLTLDHHTFAMGPGEFAFVNSQILHGATPTNCFYDCLVFHLDFLKNRNDACDTFIEKLLSHELKINEIPKDEDFSAVAEQLMRAMDASKEGFAFRVIGLAAQLFGVIQEKKLYTTNTREVTEQDAQKLQKLKHVLRFIRENYTRPISLEDMARVAGFSTKYFCSFFRSMTATTPVNYLVNYRIERAARYLLGTDKAITRIALDCGFNDLSYFIKTFKSIKGVSPKQYRTLGEEKFR